METSEIIASILISVVVIFVSLLLMKSLGYEVETSFKNKFVESLSNLYSSIFRKDYFNICDSYDEEYISVKDFETLLDAFYNGLCKDSRVKVILSFSLTRKDVPKIAEKLGIAGNGKLIVFEKTEPLGTGSLIVDGNYSTYLFKKNDQITIWYDGYPEPDTLLNLTGVNCNLEDKTCLARPLEYDEWGCPVTKNRNKGQECDCSAQCRGSLTCDETNHCCPIGESWTGSRCGFQYTFTVLLIQLNGEIDTFKNKAELAKNTWVGLTPLQQCSNNVRFIAIEGKDKVCTVPDQTLLCSDQADASYNKIKNGILACVKKWGVDYSYIYTRIEGVFPDDPNGNICGSLRGGAEGDGSLLLLTSESNIRDVSSHEMAHTFGLCDEGYGLAPCQDCTGGICGYGGVMCCNPVSSEQCLTTHTNKCKDQTGVEFSYTVRKNEAADCPNTPEQNSIMCTYDLCKTGCSYAEEFAPTSKTHLEKELNQYCE